MKHLIYFFFLFISYSQLNAQCDAGNEAAFLNCLANSETSIRITASYTVAANVDISDVIVSFSNNQNDIVFTGEVLVNNGTRFFGSGNTSATDDGVTASAGGQGSITFETLNSRLNTGNYTTLGNAINNIVPVEMLYFEVDNVSDFNILKWATISEIDNDFFSVQSSEDGKNFVQIGTIKGKGYSDHLIEYQFKDRNIGTANGTYYRLKQVDFNGQFEFSSIVFAKHRNLSAHFTYYDGASKEIAIRNEQDGQILIYNIAGNLIEKIFFQSEGQEQRIQVDDYTKGIYNVVFTSSVGELKTTKLAIY